MKSKRTSSSKSRYGEGVVLPARGRSAAIDGARIGVLTWSGDASNVSYLNSEEFRRTLELASKRISKNTDLILCSGRRVFYSSSVNELDPERVLVRTSGVPVLFEWWTDVSGKEGAEWRLIHSLDGRPTTTVVRKKQLVAKSDATGAAHSRLADAVASGAGVIRFEDRELKLLLLICGENTALRVSSERCVVRGQPSSHQARERLVEVLSGPWVALNPAHRPYWPLTIRRGAGNVVALGRDAPYLEQAVSGPRQFEDGTTSPVALIHANTFLPGKGDDREATVEHSALAYVRASKTNSAKRLAAVSPIPRGPTPGEPTAIIEWRYVEFDVAR